MRKMKAGDLIHMPGQYCPGDDAVPDIGIVIDDVPQFRTKNSTQGRVGIMWVDNWGKVDYEPRDWLEVLSEAIPLEA
jgi:hypothetical protein